MIRVLYEGKYLRLIDRDGWEYIERLTGKGVAMVIALTDDNKVVFIEQFRPAVGHDVIEFPMGIVGDIEGQEDESLELGARRELEEETGFRAGAMKLISKCPMNPGANAGYLHIYFASKLTKVSEGGGDATEDIRVLEIPYAELDAWFAKLASEEKYVDPRVFAALYWMKNELPKI